MVKGQSPEASSFASAAGIISRAQTCAPAATTRSMPRHPALSNFQPSIANASTAPAASLSLYTSSRQSPKTRLYFLSILTTWKRGFQVNFQLIDAPFLFSPTLFLKHHD